MLIYSIGVFSLSGKMTLSLFLNTASTVRFTNPPSFLSFEDIATALLIIPAADTSIKAAWYVQILMELRISMLRFDILALDACSIMSVSYTHLRAHETRHDLVCRLLL